MGEFLNPLDHLLVLCSIPLQCLCVNEPELDEVNTSKCSESNINGTSLNGITWENIIDQCEGLCRIYDDEDESKYCAFYKYYEVFSIQSLKPVQGFVKGEEFCWSYCYFLL